MYTKEVQKEFIQMLKKAVDRPVKELTEASGYSRSTINKFMALKPLKPSTLDRLMELTYSLTARCQQKRKELIAKKNQLLQMELPFTGEGKPQT